MRRVSNASTFRLRSGQQFLSQALNGENIGLEEVADGLWNILYYDTLLGRFDERTNGWYTAARSSQKRDSSHGGTDNGTAVRINERILVSHHLDMGFSE